MIGSLDSADNSDHLGGRGRSRFTFLFGVLHKGTGHLLTHVQKYYNIKHNYNIDVNVILFSYKCIELKAAKSIRTVISSILLCVSAPHRFTATTAAHSHVRLQVFFLHTVQVTITLCQRSTKTIVL